MTSQATRTIRGDDYAVWPDGTCATMDEVRAGDYNHMSDDFEVVSQDNRQHLRELGLDDETNL